MNKIFSNITTGVFFSPDNSVEAQKLDHPVENFKTISFPKIRKINTQDLSCLQRIPGRVARIYNRNTLLAIEGLDELGFSNRINDNNRQRIGIYVAGPWTVLNHEVMNIYNNSDLTPSAAMRGYSNPKYYIKNMLSHLPGHLSIHFGVNGPANCFFDLHCVEHAVQKAIWDLKSNNIELAAIIALNTYEELVVALEQTEQNPVEYLNEGTAVVLLNKENLDTINIGSMKTAGENFGYLNSIKHWWNL